MSSLYAIETAAGLAGIAIRITSGFRFYAADFLYTALERECWRRIEDLHAAVERLAAADQSTGTVVRLSARRGRRLS
jgi:hypothetical protein